MQWKIRARSPQLRIRTRAGASLRNVMRILFVTWILLVSCVTQPQQNADFHQWTPPRDMNLDRSEFLDYLVTEGSSWILSQREIMRPASVTLSGEYRDRYAAYFLPETLEAVRYRFVDVIENPDFYDDLAARGMEIPLDFSKMDGITFVDTILISKQNFDQFDLRRLLFHECVHVAQYQHLGADEFVPRYVHGWAENNFDYFAIPLEVQAYELERRFARGETFSVENAIAESLDQQ